MNGSFPFAIFAVLFGTVAQMPSDSSAPLAFLERYGFPVLVSVALWLRLERNQKDERDDRKASEQERLKALEALKEAVENGQSAHFELAVKAVESNNAHAAAVAALSEKLHLYKGCPMHQMELFKVMDMHSTKPPQTHESGTQ